MSAPHESKGMDGLALLGGFIVTAIGFVILALAYIAWRVFS